MSKEAKGLDSDGGGEAKGQLMKSGPQNWGWGIWGSKLWWAGHTMLMHDDSLSLCLSLSHTHTHIFKESTDIHAGWLIQIPTQKYQYTICIWTYTCIRHVETDVLTHTQIHTDGMRQKTTRLSIEVRLRFISVWGLHLLRQGPRFDTYPQQPSSHPGMCEALKKWLTMVFFYAFKIFFPSCFYLPCSNKRVIFFL